MRGGEGRADVMDALIQHPWEGCPPLLALPSPSHKPAARARPNLCVGVLTKHHSHTPTRPHSHPHPHPPTPKATPTFTHTHIIHTHTRTHAHTHARKNAGMHPFARSHLHEVRLGRGEQLDVAVAHELLVAPHGLALRLLILDFDKGLARGAPVRGLLCRAVMMRCVMLCRNALRCAISVLCYLSALRCVALHSAVLWCLHAWQGHTGVHLPLGGWSRSLAHDAVLVGLHEVLGVAWAGDLQLRRPGRSHFRPHTLQLPTYPPVAPAPTHPCEDDALHPSHHVHALKEGEDLRSDEGGGTPHHNNVRCLLCGVPRCPYLDSMDRLAPSR